MKTALLVALALASGPAFAENTVPFPNLLDPTPACRIVFGTPNLLPYNKCINDEQAFTTC